MILRLSQRTRGPARLHIDHPPGSGGDERVVDATLVWQALEHGVTREVLVERIVAEYGVDRVRALEGADLYMRQLGRRGLLVE